MPEILNKLNKEISEKEENKNFNKLISKEFFDRIGFGFGSQQFINILFSQIGASLFLIGLINGLRVVIGNISYFCIQKFKGIKLTRNVISWSGIIFGFSFLLMAIAIFVESILFFIIAIVISSISIVIYGESKGLFLLRSSKAYLIERFMKYSLIITVISLFVSAIIMDKYQISGTRVAWNIFNNLISIKIHGYLIVFEIAAIAFILAGYILLQVKTNRIVKKVPIGSNFGYFVKNKVLLLLTITNIIIGLVQTIGFSYYGIFIYRYFNNVLFGGFLNVAMVFLISVFTSLIGLFLTKLNARVYRKFSIFIFGVMMVGFMPFTYFFNPNLSLITIGTIIGVIGSSAVGVTNSLLVIGLVNHNMRQSYFSFINLASVPFFLIMAPALAYIAQTFGLNLLFLLLTIIMLILMVVLIIASIVLRKELI
ncbi:hypothetical protein GOV14_00325 [Candidatus Pacearchaeota archaeon]|nr:hypothetical protein [Candidatus Pacearchaeota archaeon]